MSINDPFSADELHELPTILSAPRFATYLQARNNNREDALKLYRWNLAISSAFMLPLHMLEVTFRNGVVNGIEAIHTPAWPWTQGFIFTLPDPRAPHYSPRRNLRNVARSHMTAGKVVADLNFAFWERVLLKKQQRIIWDTQFTTSFPEAPAGQTSSVNREKLRRTVENVRRLRNRIAHHEPIFARDLVRDMRDIRLAISWRSSVAASWLDKMETVTPLIALRP